MFNSDTQILHDIFEQTRTEPHWARVFCKDGEIFEGYADCMTYDTVDDDDDVDALRFILRDGRGYTVAGTEIDRFEILESR